LLHYREFYEEVGANSLGLCSFKPFAEYYQKAMKDIILPMTLREIEVLSNKYLEKHCRHEIQKRYTTFAPTCTKPSTINSQLKESNLERYLKQLNPDALETSASFYYHLVSTEPSFVELYEFTVSISSH